MEGDRPGSAGLVIDGHHPALRRVHARASAGSRPACRTTGLPSYSVQVRPRSLLKMMHSPRPVLVNAATSGGAPAEPKPDVLCRSTTRAAREAPVAILLRVEGDRQLGPVNQVAADRVAPVHVAPVPAVGIVLIEQVIFTVEPDQAVRVVQPAAPRREVELRPASLAVEPAGVGNVRRRA